MSRPQGSEGEVNAVWPHGRVGRRRARPLGSTRGGFTHRTGAVGLTMLNSPPHRQSECGAHDSSGGA